MTDQNTRPQTHESRPPAVSYPPMNADRTKGSSAPLITHKRRRLTAVAGSMVPRCAVSDSPAVPGEVLCAQHRGETGNVD